MKPAHYFAVKQQNTLFLPLTLPHVAACSSDVDVGVCDAAGDAHVAQALQLHVVVGVAGLVAVYLPLVARVVAQVVSPHVAFSHHPPLVLCAALDDPHIAMATSLSTREESLFATG